MVKVDVRGPNGHWPGETFHVHAAGCKDLTKKLYASAERGWVFDTDSAENIVTEIYVDVMHDYDPRRRGRTTPRTSRSSRV
jgi:hypothetical protein